MTPHHIPFEVYVFSKMDLIERVTLHIRRAGVNFILANSEQFQSYCAATMLSFLDPPKTIDEVFALMDEEISREGVLERMEPPRNVITSELLPHQKQGLRWLFLRENTTDLPPFWEEKGGMFVNMITLEKTNSRPGPFRGGIFADDMGMGKTLTLLSLIATDKCGWPSSSSVNTWADREPVVWTGNKFKKEQTKRRRIRGYSPIEGPLSGSSRSRPTLIVCPATVLSAWVKQLEDHVRRGSLRAYMYHGVRTKDVNEIKNYDIVLTTYFTVASEANSEESPLEAVEWWRIILDEAHEIRNPESKKCRAVTKLNASRRWVVSGTPIQNDSMDIYSLISFLRLEPFSTRYWWTECIDLHICIGDICGISRLQVLIASISLRRMKNICLDDLPPKSVEIVFVDLSAEEREVYSKMEAEAKEFFRTYYSFGEYVGTNILSLLMRLRQSCVDITLCALSRRLPSLQGIYDHFL
ncbi:hypothetical protein LIER_31458 [Lithospermum erythrorhizon]|uniref:Helicase ATP-binding domain-containing protein n=1 Tax=Lithospermum erythrorhizon TaxID=34254 RepID=A0AAV3RT52_LITER